MTNRVKGNVTRRIGDHDYTFELTANAFCELEGETGETTQEFVSRLEEASTSGKLGFRDVRVLFWASLTEHHPELSLRDAGRLMSKIGDMEEQMTFVQEVFEAAMPDTETKGKPARGKKKAAA